MGESLEKWSELPFEKKIKAFKEMIEEARRLSTKIAKYLEEQTKLSEQELYELTCKVLEERGYRVFRQPHEPYGAPDIIAVKFENETPTEYLVVEVKGVENAFAEQLRRYSIGEVRKIEPITVKRKKFILVLPVWDGGDFEVWGIKQLKPEILREG